MFKLIITNVICASDGLEFDTFEKAATEARRIKFDSGIWEGNTLIATFSLINGGLDMRNEPSNASSPILAVSRSMSKRLVIQRGI
jgi:hypothetical protein